MSHPERMRWPKGGATRDGRGRGGVLVIAVEGAGAIDIQHDSERIIARINGYYGYEAVTAVKVHQTRARRRLPRAADRRPLTGNEAARLEARLATVGDETLKAALARLGEGVIARAAIAGKKP